MHITNISQAKAQLSALIEQVLAGKEVVIGKAGRPVARLVPYVPGKVARRPGAMKGKIQVRKDFDSLPDDVADALGMRER